MNKLERTFGVFVWFTVTENVKINILKELLISRTDIRAFAESLLISVLNVQQSVIVGLLKIY